MSQIAPYGSWKSPITSELIVSKSIRLGPRTLEGNTVYWVESRPSEKGRNVIVKQAVDGTPGDITPIPFNARTRVHEYGGGEMLVDQGIVYFANFADQRLYRVTPGAEPVPITPESENALRYADLIMDRARERIICVREEHPSTGTEAINTITALTQDGTQTVLVTGNDFYASPRLSPDGEKLAWLTWNHPNMPWDGTELWVAEFQSDGKLGTAIKIAGGPEESIFQPEWSPSGILYFISDRNNWWNLYRWQSSPPLSNGAPLDNGGVEPLIEMEAEFGVPQWVFNMRTYGFAAEDQIICTYTQHGRWYLGRVNITTRSLTLIETPYTHIHDISVTSTHALFYAGSPTEFGAIVLLDLTTDTLKILKRSSDLVLDPGYLSIAQPIEFPTEHNLTAHALFYPPKNKDFTAPVGEKPPLLVVSHGGPTGATNSVLSLNLQYWISRGFAVLDVNYGGSTGYGRAYRERLNGQWGIVDIDDCVNGAKYLVQHGWVDGERLTIRGGSAGGYTTLSALTFRDIFKAGASYYGIGDLEALAKETHKFESRYLNRIVGPYPECRDLYIARSPIHHIAGLNCPVIFFQGLEDRVVPPNQAEMMVAALKEKGIPVAYVPFEGEQHGFRQAEHIKKAMDSELYFYARIFGFALTEDITPVAIENL
ncbi:MAG: S9 family peptidase [Anaerolineae bacterium]|nr:S9 family peptidase [Anaerolineae bacterium]